MTIIIESSATSMMPLDTSFTTENWDCVIDNSCMDDDNKSEVTAASTEVSLDMTLASPSTSLSSPCYSTSSSSSNSSRCSNDSILEDELSIGLSPAHVKESSSSMSYEPSLIEERMDFKDNCSRNISRDGTQLDYSIDESINRQDNSTCIELDQLMINPIRMSNNQNPLTATSNFGGLINLGNTCYMASALQMIASLDTFIACVSDRDFSFHGISDDSDTGFSANQELNRLRYAFLGTMRLLHHGDLFRPTELKSVIDGRTSLFVGYEQQDAHEFLTALLDLLDEDYKSCFNMFHNHSAMNKTISAGQFTSPITQLDDAIDDDDNVLEFANRSHTQALPGSYSTLDVNAIEMLLHGSISCGGFVVLGSIADYSRAPSFLSSPSENRCKLVGGRMVVSGVDLKSYSECLLNSSRDSNNDLPNNITRSSPTIATDPGYASLSPALCSTVGYNLFESTGQDSKSSTSTRNKLFSQEEYSPVSHFFKMKVRVRLTCESCMYTRWHEESYSHLSLEISSCTTVTQGSPADESNTNSCFLEDSIRQFFSPERREIKCEKCFCERAIRTMEITKLPRALLLHFNRFLVDVSPDYSTIAYRKNQTPVFLEQELCIVNDGKDKDHYSQDFCAGNSILSEFLADDCLMPSITYINCNERNLRQSNYVPVANLANSRKQQTYKIRSIVNHIGSNAASGHYTTDALKPRIGKDIDEREWIRFNDDIVTRLSPSSTQSVLNECQRTVYMALYELEN